MRLLLMSVLLVVAGMLGASDWEPLISQAEMDREAAHIDINARKWPFAKEADPKAPTIVVRKPEKLDDLANPVTMELVFEPADDAEIDPKSFKVYYGTLKLNITDRVLEKGTVDRLGGSIKDMPLKPGSYELALYISDTKKREGTLPMTLEVKR